jgi:hypothetical protein
MTFWTHLGGGSRSLWRERVWLGTLLAVVPGGLLAVLWLMIRRLRRPEAVSRRDDILVQ